MFTSEKNTVTASFTLLPLDSRLQKLQDHNHFILAGVVHVEGQHGLLRVSQELADSVVLNLCDTHQTRAATLSNHSADEKTLCYESLLPIPVDLLSYTLTATLLLKSTGALLGKKILVSPPVKGHDPRRLVCDEETLRCQFQWGDASSPVPIPYRTQDAWLNPEALFSAGVMDSQTYHQINTMLKEQDVKMWPELSSTGWSGHRQFAEASHSEASLPRLPASAKLDIHTGLLEPDAVLPQYGTLNFHYE